MSTVNLGGGHGRAVDLDGPEMGFVFSSIITAAASAAWGVGKSISKAVKEKKARRAAAVAEQEQINTQTRAAQQKRKTTLGLLIVGGIAAVGAGAILFTGRN